MIDGKRVRERFKTLEAAEERALQIRDTYREEGKAAFAIPADLRLEAHKCAELLKPHNATISEAVQHYLLSVLAYRTAPPIAEIIKRMLADSRTAGRRERTIGDLSYRLGRFAKTFGTRQVSSISLAELKAWIDDPTLGARSRIHNATKISQLFNYAIRQGWADANLVERITRPSIEDKAVELFTPKEASQLLKYAEPLGLLPFVAIGLFAGLRSAEIQRLDWSAVKLSERCIIIGSEVAKRRSRRVVEINDTLAAWLTLCAKPAGAVAGFREDQLAFRIRQLTKDAGLSKWKHNGLRHSFASYHLALHGDATKTAFQMGNSPVVLHNSYKGLVTNGDVQRYWSLRPAADANEKIAALNALGNE
jgi:integrase